VLALFPRLASRAGTMANLLSGGEQQMLAIGRALMTNPRLLILDEATEGLAPLIRDEIWRCLQSLRASGQSILVIDKNVQALTRIADRHTIIERGRVVWTGTSPQLAGAIDIQHRYLGI
jgi:branched-chain amino acid transport system ATP-binding protein